MESTNLPSVAQLAAIFQAAGNALRQNQLNLNQADAVNHNHGDHMVAVFDLAAQAIDEFSGDELAGAMERVSRLLQSQVNNGSAQVYGQGLAQFAKQFDKYDIRFNELVIYIQSALSEEQEAKETQMALTRKGEVLKALVAGLTGWQHAAAGGESSGGLSMGALFDLGIAYVQAKQQGGSRASILANAAVSTSPLSQMPYRAQSGRIAIAALLQAMHDAIS